MLVVTLAQKQSILFSKEILATNISNLKVFAIKFLSIFSAKKVLMQFFAEDDFSRCKYFHQKYLLDVHTIQTYFKQTAFIVQQLKKNIRLESKLNQQAKILT